MKPLEPKSLFARRYEVVRCISTGGMGAVYEVIHLDTKRRRALKVMLPNLLVDDEMRRRFALEAVITANVSSEHLIEVFDAGIEADSGCPFLAMELLDGQDLGKQLAQNGPLPVDEAVELLRQAARALDRTHAAGIVHRDLKPENLFVTRRDDGSPKIKILDFGIAKLLATAGGPSSRALGTPLFMAPEQVDDTLATVGPAADLYAVGQIAYALITGVPYFMDDAKRTDNVLAVLMAVAKGTTEPASTRAARRGVDLPAAFDGWFAKGTAREPDQRFKSAREMIEALAAATGLEANAITGERRARSPEAVAAKSADNSKPRWTSTEVLDKRPAPAIATPAAGALSRPDSVETSAVPEQQTESRPISRPPPIAASNTASLDPTVTSSATPGKKSRAPFLIALAIPAALAIGYVAVGRDKAPTPEPTSAGSAARHEADRGAVLSVTAQASNTGPIVAPTTPPSAQPSTEPTMQASVTSVVADPKTPATAKPAADKRLPVLPKASAAAPAVTVAPTGMPWETRTPVKP